MFGGGQCARCFQPIPASDLVMRSGELTFHPQCFSCQVSSEFSFGNRNYMPHLCVCHYILLLQNNVWYYTLLMFCRSVTWNWCLGTCTACRATTSTVSHIITGTVVSRCPTIHSPNQILQTVSQISLVENKKFWYVFPAILTVTISVNLEEYIITISAYVCETGQNQVSGEGEDSVSSPEPRLDDRVMGGRTCRRTKRMRTCFRSEQLRALESYFAQKHNPDGKDWTCLAHKTGLPKRVLQVGTQVIS